jgi:phosphoenolpyruvate carboxylase
LNEHFSFFSEHPLGKETFLTFRLPNPKVEMEFRSEDEQAHLQSIIRSFEQPYRQTIESLANTINSIASVLPKRRERVLHVGLFGYSRGLGGVKLPRAITFTGSLYSLGVPPELIGTGRGLRIAQQQGLLSLIESNYLFLKNDLRRAGAFFSRTNLDRLCARSDAWKEVQGDVNAIEAYLGEELGPKTDEQLEHEELAQNVCTQLSDDKTRPELLERMCVLRKSVG